MVLTGPFQLGVFFDLTARSQRVQGVTSPCVARWQPCWLLPHWLGWQCPGSRVLGWEVPWGRDAGTSEVLSGTHGGVIAARSLVRHPSKLQPSLQVGRNQEQWKLGAECFTIPFLSFCRPAPAAAGREEQPLPDQGTLRAADAAAPEQCLPAAVPPPAVRPQPRAHAERVSAVGMRPAALAWGFFVYIW